MARNEYVFENTIREPSKGITVSYPAHTRTIGEGEIHLQYASVATCAFNDGKLPVWTPGQCLLTEKNLYFVGNTRQKDRQYLEIPISKIEKVKKYNFGWNLMIEINAFTYSFQFSGSSAQKWMDSIASVKQEQSHPQPKTDSAATMPSTPSKRFCSYCGAKLEGASVYCPECGNVI